jgi:hypothetical protein
MPTAVGVMLRARQRRHSPTIQRVFDIAPEGGLFGAPAGYNPDGSVSAQLIRGRVVACDADLDTIDALLVCY